MKAIVAVDRNWAIGLKNRLLVSIPSDMKFFRETTRGGVLVMGRKTLESFPGQKPLPGRANLVLSRNPELRIPGAEVLHGKEELEKRLRDFPDKEVFLIGGGNVYREFLDQCDTAYVTRIDFAYEADTYFPDLSKDPNWVLASESEEQTCFDLTFTFCTYRRKDAK